MDRGVLARSGGGSHLAVACRTASHRQAAPRRRRERSSQDHCRGDRLLPEQCIADGLSGLSSCGPAGHVGPDGVVRERTEPAGERDGEILERRRQRRGDPASSGGGVMRRRPSATALDKPPRQPISPQRPQALTSSGQHRPKKSVPAPESKRSQAYSSWSPRLFHGI